MIIYLSFLAIPLCTYIFYRTRWGLIIRSVGENPEACWARGINPITVRMLATMVGGAMVGLAGASYSLSVKPGWGQPQGCEGIGWIALALVIFIVPFLLMAFINRYLPLTPPSDEGRTEDAT